MLGALWKKLKRSLFVRGSVAVGHSFHLGIGSFVSSPHQLTIGNNVYVGKYCSIQCSGTIGNEVLIANNVGVVGRWDHDVKDLGVPIRSARCVSLDAELAAHPQNAIVIADDVWIGFGAVLLSGISVGRGAIVSAGAVVFDDVPAYAIMQGNPARVVGMRLTPEQIEQHERAMLA